MRYARVLMLLLAACLWPPSAFAQAPISPTYPDCAKDGTLDACPPDMKDSAGEWRGITWSFVSFIREDWKRHVRRAEWETGSGNWFDLASQVTMGRYDVPIAVIDSGIRWYQWDISQKVLLNKGELSPPRNTSGGTCPNWDCDGDGWFTVLDYNQDSRVTITGGADDADTLLDPSDLIAVFSDGTDADKNGYIDDIAGFDFMWNDNNPRASNNFYHGSAVMVDSTSWAGQTGSSLGYCPNCSLIPVRVSDSFIGEANKIAQGVIYAVDRGAKVIACAMGSVTNSEFLRDAFTYAWAHDVTVVVAIGDEMSYHHLPPGTNDFVMAVHSIKHYPFVGAEYARSFLGYNGCNNYGPHLTLVASTNDCATGSTAIIGGVAGMVYSRGRELGLDLSADEVRAILTSSADDIDVPESRQRHSPYFPSFPGWDQFFGYGRVNVRRAVDAAAPGNVPPEVHLFSPRWFEFLDPQRDPVITIEGTVAADRALYYAWSLEWAPGNDPREADFRALVAGSEASRKEGVLFQWDVSTIPAADLDPASPLDPISGEDPLMDKLEKTNAHAITLRLTATDDNNNMSEFRKTFFLHEDPDLAPGFPLEIGPGDSSPALYDINGDGVLDIVVGTSDGTLHVVSGGAELPGFPIKTGVMPGTDPASSTSHLGSTAYAHAGIIPAHQGILGAVAPTDLEQDGEADILVSTLDGYLYVYTADGTLKPGFPVTRDVVTDSMTDPLTQYDPGFAAGPVPFDLDGDGTQEIILPGMDQKLYVWRADGSRQPGFPVFMASEDTPEHNKGRIYSTPAVGDITGDGKPEIVLGTNEYDPEMFWRTYVYAVHGDGNLHQGGPILPGWPAQLLGPMSSVVNYIGEGVTMSPILSDVFGDEALEVAFAAPAWCPVILDGFGRQVAVMSCDSSGWGVGADSDELAGATYLGNLTFADVDGDGKDELIGGLTGLNWASSVLLSRWIPYQDHLVVVWDVNSGEALPFWPRVIEDIMMFVKPEVGDVDGDNSPEVIMSSGGYVIHAWGQDGQEAVGWPKFTGGWIYSAIRAGDVTGDDLTDVVAVSREGYLWLWEG